MNSRFSPAVELLLISAGWYEGRVVPVESVERVPFPAARRVLEEFGGLHIGESGEGIECARSDIEFFSDFGVSDTKWLNEYERSAGVRIFPIAASYDSHGLLYVDAKERIYADNGVGGIDFEAENIDIALDKILLGTM